MNNNQEFHFLKSVSWINHNQKVTRTCKKKIHAGEEKKVWIKRARERISITYMFYWVPGGFSEGGTAATWLKSFSEVVNNNSDNSYRNQEYSNNIIEENQCSHV